MEMGLTREDLRQAISAAIRILSSSLLANSATVSPEHA
jgi:hypothetical protein